MVVRWQQSCKRIFRIRLQAISLCTYHIISVQEKNTFFIYIVMTICHLKLFVIPLHLIHGR